MAVVVPEYTAVAEQIYIAYFGRPADRDGLINMTNLLANGQAPTSVTDIAKAYYSNAAVKAIFDSFSASTESTTLYTGTDQQFIVSIYQNVLGRDPLLGGLDFWTNALATKQMTRAEAAVQIMAAAQANATDAATIANKTTVATNFTAAIDTAAEVIGYQGKTAAQTARDMLHTVNNTTDTTAFNATIASTLAALSGTTTVGTTYTLDTGVNLVNGTSLNDTIIADSTTLNPGDSINGGAGVDTLNFTNSDTTVGGTNFPAANITNVEVLNVRNVGTGVTVDASTITGLTNINADRSTGAVTVSNVADGAAVGITGNGTVVNGALSASYAANSSTATVNLAGGVNNTGTTTVAITSANTKAVVNSTGAANAIQSLALGGSATSLTINATTGFDVSAGGITGFGAGAGVTVTGAGAVALGTLAANVVTVDASAASGGVSTVLNANVTSFKGSTGNDVITTAATTATGAVINGGGGTNDILVVAATNDITTAAKGAQYTGFETVRSNFIGSFDASLIAGVTAVQSNANGAGFINLSAAQAANIAVRSSQTAGTTYSLKDATGSTDVLGLTLRASSASTVVNAQALTVTGFETLNLAVNGGGSNVNFKADGTTAAVAGTDYANVTFTAAADLKAVKVTGSNALALDVSNAAKVTSVDASANTAGINLTTGSQTGALVVTATAAADQIHLGSIGVGGTVSVDAGAGDDQIFGAQSVIAAAVIKGGAGTDTLTIADTGTVTIADNSFVNVTGVEKFALGATTGLTWTVGGYANAIATANGGVLDITAASLASTAAVSIDASGLGASNALKLSLTDSGNGGITIKQSAGADVIKVTTTGTDAITINGGTAALASTAVKTIDLSASSATASAVTVTTGAGNDIIKGGSAAATITAGKGADVITLLASHAGIQSLVFAAGDSTQTSLDQVSNFSAAATTGDTLNLGSTTLLSSAQIGGTGWTVSAGGIATKAGATVADFLAAATTSGTAGVVAFSDGANTYVVASDGTSATTDTVVELVGVTGVSLTATTASAGIHLV